jgi:hypothetical protein
MIPNASTVTARNTISAIIDDARSPKILISVS